MIPWEERSREEAHLLNPAFCGALVASSVTSYVESQPGGMPFALSMLILPVVLHKATRESLPRSIRTPLAAWLDETPAARLVFAERLNSLVPFSREGILFAGSRDALGFAEGGKLVPGTVKLSTTKFERTATDDARDCLKKAKLVGRWFAAAGGERTVLTLWGVRP